MSIWTTPSLNLSVAPATPTTTILFMTYPHPESQTLLYWKQEKSGVLEIAIHRFLNDLPLNDDLLSHLQTYCQHWADFDGWRVPFEQKEDLARMRSSIRDFKTVDDLQNWLDLALELGIDPL